MASRILSLCLALAGLPFLAGAPAAAQETVPPLILKAPTQAYDSVRFEAAYMIAAAWRELGLSVTVQPTEFSDLLDEIYEQQDFDAGIIGWSGRTDRLDPQFYLGLFDSRRTLPGGNNAGGYQSAEFDVLYDAQGRAFDPDERARLVWEAQAIAVSDAANAVLFYRDELVAYDSHTITGIEVSAGDGLYSEWNMFSARPLTDRTTLIIGGPQGPDALNPLFSTSVWGWKWMRLYYDTLLRLSPDAEPVLWAAEAVEPVDLRTIAVTLRDGLAFHDGTPLTAEDVAFSFTYFIDNDFQYFSAYLDPLDTVEALDGRTVSFRLREPSAIFSTIALSQVPILPRHIWSEIETPAALSGPDIPTVGSGPFVFGAYVAGDHMTLDRNENHFMAGEIAFSGLRFNIYPGMDEVADAMLAEQIDIIAWPLAPSQAARVEAEPGVTVVTAPDFGFQHVTFNTRRGAFGDIEFRRALVMAIDRQRIVDVLLEGRGTVGASVIAPVNAFWHNPDVEAIPFDIPAARAALEAAGYGWDASGRLLYP